MHTHTNTHTNTITCKCMYIITVGIPYTENFGRGKFWQTIQVKAIGKEKFGE